MNDLDRNIATSIIAMDTLWGGDVMNPSGTGRFIADSWYSDEPLPEAYTHPLAAKVREAGGVGGKDPAAIEDYVKAIDVRGAVRAVADAAKGLGGLRGAYLANLAECCDVMWELAMEVEGKGDPVSHDRCQIAMTGEAPQPSDPRAKRERVAELVKAAGYDGPLLDAADAWRADRMVPRKSIKALGDAFIAHFDALTERNVMPYMPAALRGVPRANVEFLPIENAWFSGSMNYIGRARNADGSPKYESTYELNASLQISIPEFQQLVSHEVVPGHVTTFAFLQKLFVDGNLGFEGTVLTMNTSMAVLAEGIANNAILMAYGVNDASELPDRDLELGVQLALLQDDAKNQSSWLTWKEKLPKEEVAKVLRNDFLCSDERADKLSGAWGRHPLLGRMYLPAYRYGTIAVARLREKHAPAAILPALFGCHGLVDMSTVETAVLSAQS
ncbi:MAG: hypothetical protein HYU52_07035 [Acidobacteria bacterium]|nr:hypothetical protein [Acidobacteriota bacterium]